VLKYVKRKEIDERRIENRKTKYEKQRVPGVQIARVRDPAGAPLANRGRRGKEGKREPGAKLSREEGFAVPGRAGMERS